MDIVDAEPPNRPTAEPAPIYSRFESFEGMSTARTQLPTGFRCPGRTTKLVIEAGYRPWLSTINDFQAANKVLRQNLMGRAGFI